MGAALPNSIEPEKEKILQVKICDYLRQNYLGVKFISSLVGERFSKEEATFNNRLQSSTGQPDLIIFAKSIGSSGHEYSFLALELKTIGTIVENKNGSIRGSRLKAQHEWLKYLSDCGGVGRFAIGFVQARIFIDHYLRDFSPLARQTRLPWADQEPQAQQETS